MMRFMLCALLVVVCVTLQMGWKEVAAAYRLNFSPPVRKYSGSDGDVGSNSSFVDEVEGLSEEKEELELLYWTDIYAPLDDAVDSTFDASTITEIDQLIRKESAAFMESSSWHLVHNQTEYSIESRAVKSNSMSVTENPMVRIQLNPVPCYSAKHMLQQLAVPHALMDTFFPLFHLYESRYAGTVTAVNEPPDEFKAESDGTTSPNNNAEDDTTNTSSTSLTPVIESVTTAELRTVIAPLIWPFDEK
jgi:hypothetical protein